MHIADWEAGRPTPAASRYMFLGVAIFLGVGGAGSFVLPLTVGAGFPGFLAISDSMDMQANCPPLQPKLGGGVRQDAF